MTTRYFIARNRWSALYQLKQLRECKVTGRKFAYRDRDEALEARNRMRSIHHPSYNVYAIDVSITTEKLIEEMKVA